MDRTMYNALLGQYSVQDLVLDGGGGWDRSVHCVLPRLEVRGRTVQATPSPTSPVEPQFVEAGTKLFIRSGTYTDADVPDYEPYFDGGTVTVPEQMIAVPGTDYYDSLDALTGSGKHRFYKITLDGVTQHKKFTELHNTNPADVFVVTMGNIHGSGDTPSALGSVTAMVCNYFPYDNSWYGNKVGAFQYGNWAYGLVAKFPYALFGVAKGEKTNDELIALANTWLEERYEAGEPLYYYYVVAEDEPFSTAPSGRLIQPRGTCNIVQSGTGADAVIVVQCVRHW